MNKNLERKNLVIKSNSLIQETRYQLSEQQQKIILYLISKIQQGDDVFSQFDFNLRNFCDLLGIKYRSGNYEYIKKNIQELSNKSFWIKSDTGEKLCRWISKAEIVYNDMFGTERLIIKLDDDLMPYLLNVSQNFTRYQLENALIMKSKYSIRLYEILLSYCNIGTYEVSLNELKEKLQVNIGMRYDNFKRIVLNKSINEINTFTDLKVDYKTIKRGKGGKIVGFIFTIQEITDKFLKHVSKSLRETELDKV